MFIHTLHVYLYKQPLPGALSDVFDEEEKIGKEFEIGATYEVCPQALALAEEVTRFIHKAGKVSICMMNLQKTYKQTNI